ncbi:MAG: hypothetical protein HEQ13_13750 [Dolichospermum sp. DEX189]|nr:hypothetical protein [Dolichospermum sp. DEX189]
MISCQQIIYSYLSKKRSHPTPSNSDRIPTSQKRSHSHIPKQESHSPNLKTAIALPNIP